MTTAMLVAWAPNNLYVPVRLFHALDEGLTFCQTLFGEPEEVGDDMLCTWRGPIRTSVAFEGRVFMYTLPEPDDLPDSIASQLFTDWYLGAGYPAELYLGTPRFNVPLVPFDLD